MELDALQENCHKCGKYGRIAKEFRSSSHGGQRSLNVHNVERNIMDSVGYGVTHHPTQIHRNEDGNVTEKEMRREPSRVQSPKGGKGGNQGTGKDKGKKGQRLNETTEHPEEQWTGGSWERWSEQSWHIEADTVVGTQQQPDRLDSSQRTITFRIDTAACKTVVPANHFSTCGHLIHKDCLLGCVYTTAGRDKSV